MGSHYISLTYQWEAMQSPGKGRLALAAAPTSTILPSLHTHTPQKPDLSAQCYNFFFYSTLS